MNAQGSASTVAADFDTWRKCPRSLFGRVCAMHHGVDL
jgi:hypothetical protein